MNDNELFARLSAFRRDLQRVRREGFQSHVQRVAFFREKKDLLAHMAIATRLESDVLAARRAAAEAKWAAAYPYSFSNPPVSIPPSWLD